MIVNGYGSDLTNHKALNDIVRQALLMLEMAKLLLKLIIEREMLPFFLLVKG